VFYDQNLVSPSGSKFAQPQHLSLVLPRHKYDHFLFKCLHQIELYSPVLMTQMPGYPYSPLEGSDGIRLLTIEAVDPEEECAEIRCKIEKFRLESAPPYRALSYAWGHTNSKAIILDGSRVKIRENLWHALWNLRDRGFSVPNLTTRYHFTKGDTKWIWIDALCIDQRNTAERNHQVRLMGQIYKTAVEVVAWLGCLKEKSNNGRDFYDIYAWMIGLNKLAEETQLGDGDYYLAGTHLLPEFNPITVLQFFDRPYWRRMWIVQEIGLASDITILFDDLSANWKGLHRLRMLLSSPSLAPAPAFTSRFQLLRTNEKVQGSQAFSLDRHRTSQQSNKLEDLIETCQDSICSDPRDKVYALLGLAVDCQNDELAVDYSKTLFQIYADVINFYHPSHSREGGPSQHTVRFSQMLQQSFDRPSELRDGAERYLLAPDSELSLSAINIFGICTSIISGLGQACNSATILLQLSKLPPHHIDARSRENMSRTIEDMRKVIPIGSRTSFALQGQ
jgi:hypothetical protein